MIDFCMVNPDVPKLMAILNVTPDSFYGLSRKFDEESVKERVREIVEQGAEIIDIGGYSSRPGAENVPVGEELRRVMLGVRTAKELAPHVAVSIDTFRSEVAEPVIKEFGSEIIINDISASELDDSMAEVAARYGTVYIAMHMRGNPSTMQKLTDYNDVVQEVIDYLSQRAEWLKERGVHKIILDPGFGFAKTMEQNYALLGGLDRLKALGYPVLAGMSRKGMIYRPLGSTAEDALAGTLGLHWEAMRKGADIIRLHDVREGRQLIDIFKLYTKHGANG